MPGPMKYISVSRGYQRLLPLICAHVRQEWVLILLGSLQLHKVTSAVGEALTKQEKGKFTPCPHKKVVQSWSFRR